MERWFPRIDIPMTWDQFRQLPQHPAFRYEYLDGTAKLSARLRRYHALASLTGPAPATATKDRTLRPVAAADWEQLPQRFAEAFSDTAPLSLLEPALRLTAARDCLERTQAGEHGLLIESASFVATADGQIDAAVLITLLQAGDLERFDDPRWSEPPPPDALQTGWGRPHLTWVFTTPHAGRRGLASALLQRARAALAELGYTELASTFLLGNEPSLLWHWKNGFRLLSYVGSPRRITDEQQRS